ncbi:hypothetical protein F4808DRAFT_469847 [Astrocystis sublimbata]|nr:hypothetical protein F4808DRAFT_469847 [Astrocystis sublimbata]
MDPLTLLGTAVNIGQVIEFGFKFIQQWKDLRDRGVTDAALNDDARRLNDLATSLTSLDPSKCCGDLQTLAVECAGVSETLILELKNLAPRDAKSKLQLFRATWKRGIKANLIEDLERRLQDCKSHLGLYLANFCRNELGDKIEEAHQDVRKLQNQLAELHLAIDSLSSSNHIGHEMTNALQPLLQQYQERLLQTREQTILDMLHFPDMHERVDTIVDSHAHTLQWLFHPLDDAQDAKNKGGRDFVTWLREGAGFFHISGKPGAGKSTLMKHICSHPKLEEYLKVWCQGSKLGRGQFFFWAPGTSAQKSLKGLLRGIIYSILQNNRNLIPAAFPDLWSLTRDCYSPTRQLEYRDIEQGLEDLFKNTKDYKFVRIVDGLDEFEGQHINLITIMKSWTDRYPLKTCISSREYPVFQQSFSKCPRILLHQCNSLDIAAAASETLLSNKLCTHIFESKKALDTIVSLIRYRAEGVFIWVSIVLGGVQDAIINGADLYELKHRIEAYPTELDDLYWHVVSSIHEADRKWAFGALKIVQYIAFSICLTNIAAISPLQLSFMDEIWNDNAATGPSDTPEHLLTTAAQRHCATYKKVYGRCKGFLHVIEYSCDEDELYRPPGLMISKVVYTHRSIKEFLETPKFIKMSASYLPNFNCFKIACGTMLKCLQCYALDVFAAQSETPDWDYGGHCLSHHWSFLLDEYLRAAFDPTATTPRVPSFHCLLRDFRKCLLQLALKTKGRSSLPVLINCYFDFRELEFGIIEPCKRLLNSIATVQNKGKALDSLFFLGRIKGFTRHGSFSHWSHVTHDQWITIVDCFLRFGWTFDFGFRTNYFHYPDIWSCLIFDLLEGRFPQTWSPSILIDWCLRHGANSDLSICKLAPKDNGRHINCCSRSNFPWVNIVRIGRGGESLLAMAKGTPLCQVLQSNGGVLELQDLLAYLRPRSHTRRSDPSFLSEVAGQPPNGFVRWTWEEHYKVWGAEDIRKCLNRIGIDPANPDYQSLPFIRYMESSDEEDDESSDGDNKSDNEDDDTGFKKDIDPHVNTKIQ